MNIQNQPSFGMALYMPSHAKIAKKLGTYAAHEAEAARAPLKSLAKNVDIYVRPKEDVTGDVRFNNFDITVKRITKNPISRWWKNAIGTPNTNATVKINREPLAETIIQTASELAQDFVKLSK